MIKYRLGGASVQQAEIPVVTRETRSRSGPFLVEELKEIYSE